MNVLTKIWLFFFSPFCFYHLFSACKSQWHRTGYIEKHYKKSLGVRVCTSCIVFAGCQSVWVSVMCQRPQDTELTEFNCSSSDAWPMNECMQCNRKEDTRLYLTNHIEKTPEKKKITALHQYSAVTLPHVNDIRASVFGILWPAAHLRQRSLLITRQPTSDRHSISTHLIWFTPDVEDM